MPRPPLCCVLAVAMAASACKSADCDPAIDRSQELLRADGAAVETIGRDLAETYEAHEDRAFASLAEEALALVEASTQLDQPLSVPGAERLEHRLAEMDAEATHRRTSYARARTSFEGAVDAVRSACGYVRTDNS